LRNYLKNSVLTCFEIEKVFSSAGSAGSGMARFGNMVFSKSEMVQGCTNAGFYDPNLDDEGDD